MFIRFGPKHHPNVHVLMLLAQAMEAHLRAEGAPSAHARDASHMAHAWRPLPPIYLPICPPCLTLRFGCCDGIAAWRTPNTALAPPSRLIAWPSPPYPSARPSWAFAPWRITIWPTPLGALVPTIALTTGIW